MSNDTIDKEWVEGIALPSNCQMFEIGVSDGLPVYLTFKKDKILLEVPLNEDSYFIEVKTKDEVIRLCDGLRVKRF